MKKFIHIIILILFSSGPIIAQSFNKEVIEENKSPLLLGKINIERLKQEPYNTWFIKNFKTYKPKQDIIDAIQEQLNQYTITIFMGTWCGDSKREVPRFYKILEKLNFPLDRVTMVAVHNQRDFYKQSPGGEHEGLNIHRVPTFIFYKESREINRIIESPKRSLEEDILAILSKKYTPKYASANSINTILNEKGKDYVLENVTKIISDFKDQIENIYELNTYANVLFFAGKHENAITVLKLNTMLFPEEANAQISLANKYLYKGDKTKAIKHYKKSLKFADNEEIRNKIKELRIASNQG